MEEKKEECKHDWQCYGVPIIKKVEKLPLIENYIVISKVKHFKTCKLCGKIELIKETE